MKPPQPGTTLDERYSLDRILGEGALGVLYEAQDTLIGQRVGVRILSNRFFDPSVRPANLLQLQRSRAFVHENIAPILDVVCQQGRTYIVTGLVDGESLRNVIAREGKLDFGEAARLLRGIMDALSWVHQIAECGQINPGNVFLGRSGVTLTECFFLRNPEDRPHPWQEFMAPEQRDPAWTGGPKADIYTSALVIAYALGGRSVEHGSPLSELGIPSTPELDRAFVAATHEAVADRSDDLKELLLALAAAAAENRDTSTATTMKLSAPEFESAKVDYDGTLKPETAASTEDSDTPIKPKAGLEFSQPGLSTHDPELHVSVDSRLIAEDDLDPEGTIDLDLDDEAVTVVTDINLDQEPLQEIKDPPDADDPLPSDTDRDLRPLTHVDTDRDMKPIELSASAIFEVAPPTPPPQAKDSETETFQIVSDQAVFDQSSLPGNQDSEDAYDTLDSAIGVDLGGEGGLPIPETQPFSRPGLPAPVPGRPKPRPHFATIAAIGMLLLATCIAIYVFSKNGSEESKPKHLTVDMAKKQPGSDPGRNHSEAPPVDSSPGLSADTRVETDAADPGETDANPSELLPADTAASTKGPSDSSAPDTPTAASIDSEQPAADKAVAGTPLEPATSAKQFKCPGGMARVWKRRKTEQPDGSIIKVVTAFCVDKYEYPGSGSMPHTNVALAQAEQACRGRGRRLCTAREWRGACGGTYPYRGTYDSSRCNTVGEDGMARPVTPAGSYSRCRSGWGTYDMVGNVAEWTRGGFVHGGSAQRDGRSATCNRKARRIGASPKVGFRCCADAKRKDIQ